MIHINDFKPKKYKSPFKKRALSLAMVYEKNEYA